MPGAGLEPTELHAHPVCGELLILGKSVIRHTQVHLTLSDAIPVAIAGVDFYGPKALKCTFVLIEHPVERAR
jgi:hypothetical protein